MFATWNSCNLFERGYLAGFMLWPDILFLAFYGRNRAGYVRRHCVLPEHVICCMCKETVYKRHTGNLAEWTEMKRKAV